MRRPVKLSFVSCPWPAPDPLTRVDLVRIVAPWPPPDPATRVGYLPEYVATSEQAREPLTARWGRRVAAGAMALAAVVVSITAVALAF